MVSIFILTFKFHKILCLNNLIIMALFLNQQDNMLNQV